MLFVMGEEGIFRERKVAEMPFEYVIQLQFSYSGQVLVLGSDRVLYGLQFEGGVSSLRPICLLYTSPSPRDLSTSRMPSSA